MIGRCPPTTNHDQLSTDRSATTMAPAPWDGVPANDTMFVLVTGGNRCVLSGKRPRRVATGAGTEGARLVACFVLTHMAAAVLGLALASA